MSGICHRPPADDRSATTIGAYTATAYSNPLNPDAYPGIRKMEAEVLLYFAEASEYVLFPHVTFNRVDLVEFYAQSKLLKINELNCE